MNEPPRVVLLMHPFAGYDRGLLEGIARYAQIHGPWGFCLSGEHPALPTLGSASISGKVFSVRETETSLRKKSFPLARWGVSGIIGRIPTPAIARTLLASG